MGGYGSGRKACHAVAEDGLVIDICRLIRAGEIMPGKYNNGTLFLGGNRTGEKTTSIGLEACLLNSNGSWLRLYFTLTRRGKKIQSDSQIELTTTRPHLGGVRWWFICPITKQRTCKLYLPDGAIQFAGRQAYRLTYLSQRKKGMDSVDYYQIKMYKKLGENYKWCWQTPPDRPKWMRQKTYDRLVDKIYIAMDRHDAVFDLEVARLLARLDHPRDQ